MIHHYNLFFSSNDSAVLIAKLELKKLNEKERWKREKERRKAMETPEEKRARRLFKKKLKQMKRRLFTIFCTSLFFKKYFENIGNQLALVPKHLRVL
jgi:hypothetical protein